jgi:acetyl esterase/lipase
VAASALRRPLSASRVVGATPVWSEPRLQGGRLFWLERRPGEGGRTTLLCRPLDDLTREAAAARELVPATADLRSRVHDYGGGAYCLGGDASGRTTVVWVNDPDRALWCLELPPLAAPEQAPGPRPLTAADPARRFADGLIDPLRQRWIGVLEQGEAEALVAVPLSGGEPLPLRDPADFCGYATLSPSGSHLAWVEWQRPWMPWERSQLWLGRLTAAGELVEVRAIAGSGPGDGDDLSIFQPLWLPSAAGPAALVVACDRSGWWNLELLEAAEALGPEAAPQWRPLFPQEAEFAMPQWVYGMRTCAWDGEALVAMACRQGRWELGRLPLHRPGEGSTDSGGESSASPAAPPTPEAPNPDRHGTWELLAPAFDDLGAVVAEAGRVVALAASPCDPSGLLEIDQASGRWRHSPASPRPLPAEAISRPEAIVFAGEGGQPCQAWYYPPLGGARPDAPLLLRAHSGPTGMARTGLNLAIQFWTSRGWGVLDVNYGGSTGFGRAYRQRLDGRWGVVDVADCAAAARCLVEAGRADRRRIAMDGGSAAGFTVLALLCGSDVLAAGACRYAVADLEAMARQTHRFEARYLDRLVGPWPEAAATYRERSPLGRAAAITAPVIFFQGLDDRVVPPDQTERMALSLGERGVPVEVHLFPGEGHGFRDGAVQQRVLEATEAFFRRHLGLA